MNTENTNIEKTLGQRIKFFRTRAGLSQAGLEVEAGLPFGTISRIETSYINPLKETISKISQVLKLNSIELDYLIGISKAPATEEELIKVRQEVKEFLNKKFVLAYLLDDRLRIIDVSDDFFKFLKINHATKESIIGKSIISITLDKEIGILERLVNPEETLYSLFDRFYSEMGFMIDDQYYQEAINSINSNALSKEVWGKVSSKPPMNLVLHEKRGVNFKVMGMTIPLYYTNELLRQDRRFQLVEYQHTNKLINFLSKIVN